MLFNIVYCCKTTAFNSAHECGLFNKMTEKDDKAFCVIGRPIYKSENPLESLKKIVSQ